MTTNLSCRKEGHGCSGKQEIEGWRGDQQGAQGTFGGDGPIHYLGCGDDFKGVYLHQNLSNVCLQCVQCIAHQLYLKKATIKKISIYHQVEH